MTFSLLSPDMICLRRAWTPVARVRPASHDVLSASQPLLLLYPLVTKKHPPQLCTQTAAPPLTPPPPPPKITTPKFHGSQALFSQLPGLFLLE